MFLKDVIDALKKLPPDAILLNGFSEPHSYRGYYDQLCFESIANQTVKHALTVVEGCVGATYEGYKGGEYTMHSHTPCWFGSYGTANGREIDEGDFVIPKTIESNSKSTKNLKLIIEFEASSDVLDAEALLQFFPDWVQNTVLKEDPKASLSKINMTVSEFKVYKN